MATVAVYETRETALRRLAVASLSGPGVGAVLLALMLFVTHANFREGDTERATLDWQIVLRLATCGACGLYGLAHLRATAGVLCRFPGAWCVLFAAWGTLTVPLAMDPTYAMAAAAALWCGLLLVPAVLGQLGGRKVVIVLLATITTYVVISWGVYLWLPSVGRTAFTYDEVVYRMGGLGHPNDLGGLAALGIALLFILRFADAIRWRSLLVLMALFVITLIYAESRTSMVAAAGAAAVCLWRARPPVPLIAGCALAVLLVAGLAWSVEDREALASLTRSGEESELYDLTGRTYVWEFVAGKIEQAPLVGYGYNCARFVMVEFNRNRGDFSAVFHPHNLLLNVLLGMGVPGGFLLLGMIAGQVVEFFKHPSILPDITLGIVLIGGLCEVVIFFPFPGACTLLWLTAVFWRPMGASLEQDSGPLATETI
jgi:hypothetical protein